MVFRPGQGRGRGARHSALRGPFRPAKAGEYHGFIVADFGANSNRRRRGGRSADPFRPASRSMQAGRAAALPPRSAPRSEHAARCECSVSETPRAAADRDAATPRKTALNPAPPGQRDGQLCEKAPPGFSPPHAASRTLFTTKKSVRSDAHYVGKTGLRLSRVRPLSREKVTSSTAARTKKSASPCLRTTGRRLRGIALV